MKEGGVSSLPCSDKGFPGGLSVIFVYIFFLKADGPLTEAVLPHRSSYHSNVFVFSQCLFIFNR